jgi:hypothetical protein
MVSVGKKEGNCWEAYQCKPETVLVEFEPLSKRSKPDYTEALKRRYWNGMYSSNFRLVEVVALGCHL